MSPRLKYAPVSGGGYANIVRWGLGFEWPERSGVGPTEMDY